VAIPTYFNVKREVSQWPEEFFGLSTSTRPAPQPFALLRTEDRKIF
jgi:hypothetical protein